MQDDPTPEQIAARLTAAQRKAMLWLPADGGAHSAHTMPPFALVPVGKLEAAGLVKVHLRWENERTRGPASSYLIWPTNLGIAVRAVLAKDAGHE